MDLHNSFVAPLTSFWVHLSEKKSHPASRTKSTREVFGATATINFSDDRSGRNPPDVLFWFRAEPVRFRRRGI